MKIKKLHLITYYKIAKSVPTSIVLII